MAANHVRVTALSKLRGKVSGAVLEGREGSFKLHCRAVVNTTGPWLDYLRLLEDPRRQPAVRLSKGVHLVLPLEGEWRAAMALTLRDGRHVYAVPWHGTVLVGTTDTSFEGDPGSVVPTPTEEAYLLEAASRFLPNDLVRRDRVLCSFAGLRVLRPGHEPTFDASREHLLSVGPAGMVSIAGGKLTTHRPIALDALRALPSEVRPRRLYPSLDPLPGASPPDEEWAVTAEDVTRRRTTLAVRGLDAESVSEGIAAVLAEGTLRSVILGPKSFNEIRPS